MAKTSEAGGGTSCLLSLQGTRSLLAPIEASKKIKYTCIAASQSYVALGANSGGVYCFHREGFKFIRILANKEGSVSQVRFSPAENNLAVVSGGGHVCLWELNPQEHSISKRLHVCSLLKDATVRDMVWDGKGSRVFFGDDTGRVAVTYLPKQQKLFKKPDELVLQEKVSIVQLDIYHELLLVSTLARCLIHKLVTKETLQVGTRPRDGLFGACFHRRWADRPPIVFSARPGGRLWQADVEGTVVSTIKLKDAVSMSPSPVLGVGFSPDYAHSSHTTLTPSLNFSRLFLLHNSYMVGWVNKDLFLFEPAAYRLAAWTSDLGSILDLFCDGRQLFVLSEGVGRCGSVSVMSFVGVGTCVQWLVKLELMDQAAKVLEAHCDEVLDGMDSSDGMLYNSIHTVLASLKETTPLEPLRARLMELEKLGHVVIARKPVEKNTESNIEEPAELENGFQTIDLTAYPEEWIELDGVATNIDSTDHVTFHVTSEVDNTDHVTSHVTSEVDSTDHVTSHVTSEEVCAIGGSDPSADFPLMSTSGSEPVLDSTLIPTNHLDNSDAELGPDDLVDPLASSSHTQAEAPDQSNDTLTSGRDESTTTLPHLPPFPEETGREIPRSVARSQSQTIPSGGGRGQSLESTPECGTSVLSPSQSLSLSLSEPQSFERRSSLDQEMGYKKPTPDFANRVAAALLVSSPQDDQVVAIPVKSSGSSKEGGKAKSKRKGSRKKKSPSPVHAPPVRRLSTPEHSEPASMTSSPSRSFNLMHIPEETLPFPEAGLPPTTPPHILHQSTPPSHTSHPSSYQNSASSSVNVSPHPSRPHSPPPTSLPHSPPPTNTILSTSDVIQNGFVPGYADRRESQDGGSLSESLTDSSIFGSLQKPSALLSKVKNIARQGGVSLDSSTLQKQVKMVKGLLSSLANSQGPSSLQDSHTTLYNNENFQAAPPPATPPPELGEAELPLTPPPLAVEETDSGPILDPRTIAFVEATNTTWQQLEDPHVLSSSVSMETTLRAWLPKLDDYRTHLSTLVDKTSEREATNRGCSVFLSSHYYQLSETDRRTVSDVASLCLEMGCYGDDLPPLKGLVDFVLKCYPVLDTARVEGVLSQQEWTVRVDLWKQLSTLVDPGETTLTEVCSDNCTESYKLPAMMRRLCRQSAGELVDACVSHFPWLSPWEVMVSFEISQSESQNQSCDEHMMQLRSYIDYLGMLAESRRDELSAIFCEDSALLSRSLSATLKCWAEDPSGSASGLLEVLTDSCVFVRGEPLTEGRSLCLAHSYWTGVIQLSVAMGDKRQALTVLLHLKDLSLFVNQPKWANLLKSLEDWQLLLELISSTDIHLKATPTSPTHTQITPTKEENTLLGKPVHPVAGTEPTSQSLAPPPNVPRPPDTEQSPSVQLPAMKVTRPITELTWSGLLRLMMEALPPMMVVKLLSDHHGNKLGSVLSEQLHGALLQLAQIHGHQRALAHSLLERVDQYLWCPRPSAVGPQLLWVQNSETPLTERSQNHSFALSVTSVTPLSEWLEDASGHWGVRSKPGSTCPMCRLSLLSSVSDLTSGVIALHCGHSYHKCCLPESACVECFAANMRDFAVERAD